MVQLIILGYYMLSMCDVKIDIKQGKPNDSLISPPKQNEQRLRKCWETIQIQEKNGK